MTDWLHIKHRQNTWSFWYVARERLKFFFLDFLARLCTCSLITIYFPATLIPNHWTLELSLFTRFAFVIFNALATAGTKRRTLACCLPRTTLKFAWKMILLNMKRGQKNYWACCCNKFSRVAIALKTLEWLPAPDSNACSVVQKSRCKKAVNFRNPLHLEG